MIQIDRQLRELDRWENEGGALATGSAMGASVTAPKEDSRQSTSGEVVKASPVQRGPQEQFFPPD